MIMSIIYKLYGSVLNENYAQAIQEYQDELLGMVAEEIVIKQNEIVSEVMKNNSAMTIRLIREEVMALQSLYEDLNTVPLLANTKVIAKCRKDDVDAVSEKLILAIQGNKEEN